MEWSTTFWLYPKDKIETPYDLTGLRFRSAPLYIPFFEALGIEGITLPLPEIYTALEQGLVEGFAATQTDITPWGLEEVLDYWIEPPFWQSGLGVIINLDSWNKLPKNWQDFLIEQAIETEKFVTEFNPAELEKEFDKMQAAGMEPIVFSPSDAEWFLRTANQSGWENYIKKYPDLGPKVREFLVK